ncbi:metallophosphoesterase 1-like [Pollicipes pollicipes]|uniref:metallophosphoesterase 1-like n=1 Tax=Pollicipes pollicipes TaxID=41117 RepID=UPI0018855765|nr:metallophosphoesterase 1-like [Pollicipes pollicipes]
MAGGCQCRVVGVFAASLLAFCVLLLLYCEVFHHYAVLAQCAWPAPLSAGEPGLRLMLLADTHLLGSRHGHWFDKLRREWQMHRSYVSAVTLHQPHAVVFLGDLHDEGKWSGPEEFQETVRRFDSLFPISEGLRRLVVAGNHDIGFHYSARPHLWSRFDAAHNTSGVTLVSLAERVHLVLINSVAMEGDRCQLCAAADRQLRRLAEVLRCSEAADSQCAADLPTLQYSRPIVLQHYPLYRASDAHCAGPDAAPPAVRTQPFRAGWECLSAAASSAILTRLRPRLVASGHTHHACRTEHRTPLGPVTEHSVPSFSWRNRADPSFLMLRVNADSHAVLKCWMADERGVVALYLVGVPAALVLSFVVTARRRVIRRWNGPEARSGTLPDRQGKQE